MTTSRPGTMPLNESEIRNLLWVHEQIEDGKMSVSGLRYSEDRLVATIRSLQAERDEYREAAIQTQGEFERWASETRPTERELRAALVSRDERIGALRSKAVEYLDGWAAFMGHAARRHGCKGGVPGEDRFAWIEKERAGLTEEADDGR